MLRASDVDSRGLKTLFPVEFVLRLPQTSVATVTTNPSNLTTPPASNVTDKVVEEEQDLHFELGNLGDENIIMISYLLIELIKLILMILVYLSQLWLVP